MAGPLRRVSQNYNWTLKRAHNDLHNSITSGPPPAPTSSSNVETAVLPWDSPGLQWKFKSEYDELREHLGRSLLILFGWWLTIGHLVEQFVADQAISQLYKRSSKHAIRDTLSVSVWGLLAQLFPIPVQKARSDQPVSHLYKQGAELSIRDVMSITVWGLFAPLFRYAKPRIALPTQPFFSRSANGFGVDKMEESDANPASSHSARRPLPDEQPDPDQSPNIESIASEHPEDSPTITVMSDPVHSTLEGSYMDALKERLQSAMHIGEGMLFYGSPTLDDDIEKPHELGSILLMETLLASVVLTFPRQAPIRRSVKARLGLLSHALQQTMALPLWTRIPLLIIPCIFLCEIFISMLYLNINVGE